MEIIRHWILKQTLLFLTRLPTRQDGIKNRDKVYLKPLIGLLHVVKLVYTLRLRRNGIL